MNFHFILLKYHEVGEYADTAYLLNFHYLYVKYYVGGINARATNLLEITVNSEKGLLRYFYN